MPKLWNETIETHRDAVRGAVLDAAARLVAEQGLAGVTMSSIAQVAGIGRATLYKYFADVDSILSAWHERQIREHLRRLGEVGKQATESPRQQLRGVLEAYAFLSHSGHGSPGAVRLHRGPHVGEAQQHLVAFLAEILHRGAEAGDFREDAAPEELAAFCLYALEGAAGLASREAVLRLVDMTLAGVRSLTPGEAI